MQGEFKIGPLSSAHHINLNNVSTLYKKWNKIYFSFSNDSAVKNLPAMQETQETWVQPLVREYPLEKEMAIHSSILAWRIPWTEESGGLQSMGSQRVGYDVAA